MNTNTNVNHPCDINYDLPLDEACHECSECSTFCDVCGSWYPDEDICEDH